jgi:MFS family permease
MLNDNLTTSSECESYKKGKIRFLLLLLIVLVAFGNEYAFNNPQALEETLYEHLDITETQFQLFYSLYSFPNIFTLFFIGYFLDKFGMRLGIIILSIALMVFQLIFAIGGQIKSYELMLVGRILFGVASRSLFIPQASIISFWFKGK